MVYAAKEALFKALGTGKTGRMAWSDIEIRGPGAEGRPEMTLSGETAAEAERTGVTGVHLALAGCRDYGVAWVVVSGGGPCPAPAARARMPAR
jgi:holo-[acyl-carrier protein] synthase